MWDPNTGLGTVTHQNIGYLFPMGPYYTVVQWLGVPIWVGQRIWMGSLLFAAGLGVLYCARRLGLVGAGAVVAALAYTLSPYMIDYLGRTSAILMPWAALGLDGRVDHHGGPAMAVGATRLRFAVVVALVGGVNATSILLVLARPRPVARVRGVGNPGGDGAARPRPPRPASALSAWPVSLWWAAGLWAEGKYGLNILRVHRDRPDRRPYLFGGRGAPRPRLLVLLRLGQGAALDRWRRSSYTQSVWLLAVSFAVPAVAVALGLASPLALPDLCRAA